MSVVVYSLPNCVQCEQTKKLLTAREIEFETVMINENPDAVTEYMEAGHKSAPIVVAGDKVWSGFRVDLINELAVSLRESA
jgi:glutaredoxin-like protein NrdH